MKVLLTLIIALAVAAGCLAADNQLTARERQSGWQLLFDGKTWKGWTTSKRQKPARPIENGCINPHKTGGVLVVYNKPFKNFILKLDFKISKGANSGVYLRTYPLDQKNDDQNNYNGLEVQIVDSSTNTMHDTGAIYDLVAPSMNNMKPAGEWNSLIVRCDENLIDVVLNGEIVTKMDIDEFTEPHKRPDGSNHKFNKAWKDHPRSGFIGFQDHGHDVWFKNIKIRPLD